MLGTGDKAENKTDLVPALEGLTERREKQSRPQTRQLWQCREMRAVPRKAPGGSGSTKGHPAQPWREGLRLFYSLLSSVPCICWGQECGLTERQSDDWSKSDQCVKVQLRSCTPPGRLL